MSKENSYESPKKDIINSYFNIEIKNRKDQRTVVYSTLDKTNGTFVKSPLTEHSATLFQKTPIGYEKENVYENIKSSPCKRWITPSCIVPLQSHLPSVNYKGVIPSAPAK